MYDLAIVGLGSTGLEALKIAISLGLKAIAFEENEIGGSYINSSYIPTKSILHTSKLLKEINTSSMLGLNLFSDASYNWQKILDRKTQINMKFKMNFNSKYSDKFTLIKSQAELFVNDDGVEIFADDNIYQAQKTIISTGSRQRRLKNFPIDNKFILNQQGFFKLQNLPKKITISSSSPIGIIWANILSNLNVSVKLVENGDDFINSLDIDIQKELLDQFEKNKIEFYKNDFLDKLSNDIVHLKSQTAFESDVVFIADEKIPYIPKIMLNGCKEQLKLKAYEDFSCDIDNLYLIGSAAGKIISPQEAKYQAQYLMNQLFKDNNIGLKTFPKVFEGQNEIASFGINEQDISDIENYTIKKVHINSSINYLAQNSSYGLIKLIIKDNLIKGAHIIANNANELITPLVMAIENEITTDKLKEQVFIYSPEFSLILDMLE